MAKRMKFTKSEQTLEDLSLPELKRKMEQAASGYDEMMKISTDLNKIYSNVLEKCSGKSHH